MEKGSILKYMQGGGDREQKELERSSKQEAERIEKRKEVQKT